MTPKYPNRLAEARDLAGMTQQQVANAVDLTVTGYQNYEWGKRDIRSSSLRKLSKVLGVSVDFLLGISDISRIPEPRRLPGDLSPDEMELLRCYRSTDERGRETIMGVARGQAGDARDIQTDIKLNEA